MSAPNFLPAKTVPGPDGQIDLQAFFKQPSHDRMRLEVQAMKGFQHDEAGTWHGPFLWAVCAWSSYRGVRAVLGARAEREDAVADCTLDAMTRTLDRLRTWSGARLLDRYAFVVGSHEAKSWVRRTEEYRGLKRHMASEDDIEGVLEVNGGQLESEERRTQVGAVLESMTEQEEIRLILLSLLHKVGILTTGEGTVTPRERRIGLSRLRHEIEQRGLQPDDVLQATMAWTSSDWQKLLRPRCPGIESGEFVTLEEALRIRGCSERTLRRLVSRGRLRVVLGRHTHGRLRMYRRVDLTPS